MDLSFSNRFTNLAALFLLSVMFALAFLSMKEDALTFDELAHIPAGYSYLTQQDFRINPEHPPLAKDLAALPLLFLDLNFPTQSQNWLQEQGPPPWWVQFDLGTEFLYRSGNDPLQIVFWSRIPMIVLLLALGLITFLWARKLGGNKAGLIALALFSLSPTLLAHGRLVTTDVAAALGAVISTFFWIRFLEKPTKKHIFFAGIAFGAALLMKFSLALLIPFFGILALLYPLLTGRRVWEYLGKAFVVGIVGVVFVIWPVYAWHVADYPTERQLRDTVADLLPDNILPHEQLAIEMTKQPVLKPLGQYLRGMSMALQRSTFGNTTYFQGEIGSSAFRAYFPTLYFLKESLAFHFISLLGIAGILLAIFRNRFVPWIREHFTLFAIGLFLVIYWLSALAGNLTIGIRHLLPVLPFTYLLISYGLMQWKTKLLGWIIFLLFLWYAATPIIAFPSYISYYNELGGGIRNGYTVAVDSNYDWGQDFYRLVEYVEDNDIEQISVDYFGGEDPSYWLDNKYRKLDPFNPPQAGWVAVSVNQLMGGIAEPVPGFDQPTGFYDWLRDEEPAAKAGTSIFIYSL